MQLIDQQTADSNSLGNNNTINGRDANSNKGEIGGWMSAHCSPSRVAREKSEETDRRSAVLDSESGNFLAEMDGLRDEVNRVKGKSPGLRMIRAILEHRYCHYLIIGLVVFDVFLVVSSLLVEIRTVEMKCQEHLRRARESEASSLANLRAVCNDTTGALANFSAGDSGVDAINATARVQELLIVMLGNFDVQQLHSLEIVEEVLHFTGLAIICIFVVEVTLKVAAFCPEFFRSKVDVLDMLLVYISFICELVLSVSEVRIGVREAVFVAMLLRLWRIARIVSGVVISMKTKYEGEIIRLKTKLKAAAQGSRTSLCTTNQRSTFFKPRQFSEANFQIANFQIVREKNDSSSQDGDVETPLAFSAKRRESTMA